MILVIVGSVIGRQEVKRYAGMESNEQDLVGELAMTLATSSKKSELKDECLAERGGSGKGVGDS